MSARRSLIILGTRGVPAAHGGFETFAERFSQHMTAQGWQVTVYCQAKPGTLLSQPVVDDWKGVRRVTFQADGGARGTMLFDWLCVQHALREPGVALVLGYNTAAFSALLVANGQAVLTNMDGIEWKRAKWPWHGRAWLYLNEIIGAITSTKLIADHPEIARHLSRRRSMRDIAMIPYGADEIRAASAETVKSLGLEPSRYLISIGRIEPENNILTMIQAFTQKPRDIGFVCLGNLEPEKNAYHAEVIKAGAGRVLFPGAIYDPERVKALRFHAAAYCHGHSVGGTNPSLVESLGCGNAVVAHDNAYNRWVAGPDQLYFNSEAACSAAFDMVEADQTVMMGARDAARIQHRNSFQWSPILEAYEALCQDAILSAHSTKRRFVQPSGEQHFSEATH